MVVDGGRSVERRVGHREVLLCVPPEAALLFLMVLIGIVVVRSGMVYRQGGVCFNRHNQ